MSSQDRFLRLLFLGDIVGDIGRAAVIAQLHPLRKELEADFVIVNGENTAGGRGITPKIAISLMRAGASVITTGDHIWDQKEIEPYIDTEPRLLRPINYPPGVPGQGTVVLETSKAKVGVINVQGRSFMRVPLENPFLALDVRLRSYGESLRSFSSTCTPRPPAKRLPLGVISMVVSPLWWEPTRTFRQRTSRFSLQAPLFFVMQECAGRIIRSSVDPPIQ